MGNKMRYTVKLSACGNPDFRQGRTLPGVRSKTVKVATLRDASVKCREYIREHDLGGGNWNGGQVYEGETMVARISYNGKAFTPESFGPNKIVDGKVVYPPLVEVPLDGER